jgi:glycosyltransferase involved in cell wall biosynthesis
MGKNSAGDPESLQRNNTKMKKDIKVSIITASLNSQKRIEDAILSILNQTYKNIEYIIIDGGSTDGTVDIIKKYGDRISYWSSEPDNGISNAFNKGLAVATGDYVNFQGADDYLLGDDVIESMMKDIDTEKDILLCGRIERIKESKEKKIVWKTPKKFTGKQSLLFKMSLPHQALFTNKNFFKKYGVFDTDFKICMDYELLLRAYKDFPEVTMKDIFVSAWREGGIGTGKTLKVYWEYLEAKRKNKIAPFWFLYAIYLWSIIKYEIKSFLNIFKKNA